MDAEQLGDGGVRVVEAVQQNLRYLPPLLPYQPEGQAGTSWGESSKLEFYPQSAYVEILATFATKMP